MEAKVKVKFDWVLCLACVLPLLGFWAYGLFDLDEGFYGAVVRDMMRRNDWITPTLNGVPWFEKPILAYWLAIPSVQLFGDAVGPRLPSVLCTLATSFVVFRFTTKHFSANVARIATIVYGTNLLVVGIGRMMMTDAPLVLCLTLAITMLADFGLKESRGAGFLEWMLIGFCVGLGILAKGPVALILFGGVFLVSSVLIPGFKGVWKSAWPLGFAVCAVVLACWYVPCFQANGQAFIQKFLVEQNIGRFAGGDKAHAVPFWVHPIYFPAILFASFLPFVALSSWNRVRVWKNPERPNIERFLWICALVPLVFFSISGTKLPHYILPAVAPFAILLAVSLAKARSSWRWDVIGLGWACSVLLLAQFVSMADYKNRMQEVRDAAYFLNYQLFKVYVYKIGGSGDTSISLQLRETSHPSFSFYFRGGGKETADPQDWKEPGASYIVMTTKEIGRTDPELQPICNLETKVGTHRYIVNQQFLDFPGSKRFILVKHTETHIQ